jgi:transposase-like protein
MMIDPLEALTFFALFGDDEDVTCPYCQADLTVTSEEARVGEESFQCNECQGVFAINWDEEKIYYDA